MKHAIGLSVHTGWAACVVVGGSPKKPEIVENLELELLGDAERFCFHMAANMDLPAAKKWIARVRSKASANAKRALAPLVTKEVVGCAIVAKPGEMGPLEQVLAAHPRIHAAEGFFYRDVLREAVKIPVQVVHPKTLDDASVAKLAPPPWGKDQRLAALAAWSLLARR